jgi:LmbE family N-acetylglucosaminyl deacetylase
MVPDPARLVSGTLALVAPHMDDELIGCGGIVASIGEGSRVHVIYATDGSASPSPPFPSVRVDRLALAGTRREEAVAGLHEIGVPAGNAHFLGLPDGRLRRERAALEAGLENAMHSINPRHLLTPFRFDRHPDHLAVTRAVRALSTRGLVRAEILEYFVYARWKLLRGGDIRRRVRRDLLLRFDLDADALASKRQALEAHRTQTTLFFTWQTRVNLTGVFLDEVCTGPEYLLRAPSGGNDSAIFDRGILGIRVAHALEPRLKRGKDRVLGWVRGLR